MDTEIQNELDIDLETPYRWGKEDALEGQDRINGLSYYAPGTPALAAYNAGYDDGLVIWAILCGEAVRP